MVIVDIKAREILDSRGFPTVEVDMYYNDKEYVRSSVPSGASCGSSEALELRDGGNRFLGKGVRNAIDNIINVIKPNILGKEFSLQDEFDKVLLELDGTDNKSKLGANAILPVSLCFFKAMAKCSSLELYQMFEGEYHLPKCMMNIFNGGMHANNGIAFQEFMIIVNRDLVSEQLEIASCVFHTLEKKLKSLGYFYGIGDEGGFSSLVGGVRDVLDLIVSSIKELGYVPGRDVSLALDVAASSFYEEGLGYKIDGKYLDRNQMIELLKSLVRDYPIVSIEDGLEENDFEGFSILTKELGIMIVGDDLFTTNVKRLDKGIKMGAGNAILIKANQIGSISEMLNCIKLAKDNGYEVIISHRSGETLDTFIADFAVGSGAGYIKSGSVTRGERVCKYNRLLRIEEEL